MLGLIKKPDPTPLPVVVMSEKAKDLLLDMHFDHINKALQIDENIQSRARAMDERGNHHSMDFGVATLIENTRNWHLSQAEKIKELLK